MKKTMKAPLQLSFDFELKTSSNEANSPHVVEFQAMESSIYSFEKAFEKRRKQNLNTLYEGIIDSVRLIM